MKITRLALHRVALSSWSGASRYAASGVVEPPLEALVLRLDADEGLTGWGEAFTPPPFYAPGLTAGTGEAIRFLAPLILGADPRHHGPTMARVNASMRGLGPARSAIDMALLDLWGKACGLALVDLWGGRVADSLPVLAMVSIGSIEETLGAIETYRDQGYERFQIKVADRDVANDIAKIRAVCAAMAPRERCWFDANRGWSRDDAMIVMGATRDLNPLFEQPCETYEDCRAVARAVGARLMLDEALGDIDAMIRAHGDGALNVATLKLSCVGGLSAQRFMAEFAARARIPLRLEDYFGTGITFAAVAHLAHTLPEAAIFGLYDYVMEEAPTVLNPLKVEGGRTALHEACGPGLGLEINEAFLGEPIMVLEEDRP